MFKRLMETIKYLILAFVIFILPTILFSLFMGFLTAIWVY